MKTTKIFLSIAVLALATTSFAQLSDIKEKLFHKHKQQVAYYTADYNKRDSGIENWMYDLYTWDDYGTHRDAYEAPKVIRTIHVKQADVMYKDEIWTESWMTAPFECSVVEAELNLESWMTMPFESSVVEAELSIEPWMTNPFEAAENIEVEDWMDTVWI